MSTASPIVTLAPGRKLAPVSVMAVPPAIGPFGSVTSETFGQPCFTDYRNPVLAEAMRVLGLVQRFGYGIPAARTQLAKAGHPPPEFEVNANWVRCTVRARP